MHRTAAAATSHVCSAHLRVTPGRHSRRMLYNAESSGPARSCWHAERVLHLTAYRAPLRRNRHRANSVCACMRDTAPAEPAGTLRASYISHPAMRRSAAAVTTQTQCAHLRVTPGKQLRRMLDTADSSGPARTCWHAARVLQLTPSHAPLRRSRHNANTVCASPRDAWQTFETNSLQRRLQWARAQLLARCARLTSHTQPCAASICRPSHSRRAPLRRNLHRTNTVCASPRDAWQAIKTNARHRQTPVVPRAPAGTLRASYISHPAVRRSAAAVTALIQCDISA